MKILLGFGSNLGDRKQNIKDAIGQFNFIDKVSSPYETKALLPEGAPLSWDLHYINVVASGNLEITDAHKDLLALLAKIKQYERRAGRDQQAPRWSPRVIDIDILACGFIKLNTEELIIPHPQFLNRDFTLEPAKEIEPEFVEALSRVS
jgi:2-amino-4-hydroxy-6-hydroxymethyldihydropteridine diphosphokinase/dihydropteroate synthase